MGLSIPAAPVVRIQPTYRHSSEVKTAPTVSPRVEKIRMIATNNMIPLIYINGHYVSINERLLKKLRAGDLSVHVSVIAIGVIVYVMCLLSGVDAFAILEQIESSNNRIEIQVGDQIYIFKNPYRQNADELQFKLAEKIYDSIRECDTDICDITENLGFKANNIKNVKDHVFYNEHDLDRYGPDEIEHKRFDATLEQALAWKRLETGTYTQDDVTWIKHECAERHHELKYNSGYTEAHKRAQSRYEGYPWENKF